MKRISDCRGLTAVVTGGSGGIGLEFSKVLASKGADVVMVSVQREELRANSAMIESRYGVKCLPLYLDLTQPDAVAVIENFLSVRGMEADILINDAGIFSFCPADETSAARTDCFINLHVGAVTRLSQAFGRRMRARGRGCILNMSSMSCWMPMPGISLYSATKAYIRVLSRAMYYELRDYNVSVTVACPGGIATDLFGLPENLKRLAVKIGALQTPEAFARKAVGKMLRRRKQYINGWLNRLAIFFIATMPTPARMLVKHKLLDKGIRR